MKMGGEIFKNLQLGLPTIGCHRADSRNWFMHL